MAIGQRAPVGEGAPSAEGGFILMVLIVFCPLAGPHRAQKVSSEASWPESSIEGQAGGRERDRERERER